MSSTPLWVPLVVAGVGVLATLSATIFTQAWSARREDKRWSRDREVEERRWQREQEERREQWRREDRARWLDERRAVYAKFLLSLDAWSYALSDASDEVRQKE